MASITDEIRENFNRGDMMTRLIYINVGVFLIVNILKVLGFFFNFDLSIAQWFTVKADPGALLLQPWGPVTYMFLHEGFLHILFNMIWLYFGGRIFLEYMNEKKLLSVYLLGGLAGAALYILSYNLFPVFANQLPYSQALGASASVMAIFVAIAAFVPDYTVRLMFIGTVKLKHIAIFYLLLDLLSIPNGNAGGHIAHLGGALFGFLYARQMQKGSNIASGFERFLDNFFTFFKPKPKMHTAYKSKMRTEFEYHEQKASRQAKLDAILDKISASGYDSLTKDEKDFLFKMNKD